MKQRKQVLRGRKSIFRALFIPLFLIMVVQAVLFYFTAVYGGVEQALTQNAADVFEERLVVRKTELEMHFNNKWTRLEDCANAIGGKYAAYQERYGSRPMTLDTVQPQIDFLADNAGILIETLRKNEVNGIFLILNDKAEKVIPADGESEQKYGLCIRDMHQDSNFSGTEDLLIERAPSSIINSLKCSLDSWWEAKYTFNSVEDGDYYYMPVQAAWDNPGVDGESLAYCAGVHNLSGADQSMLIYSIPLTDGNGYPYGVLGIEMSTKYLASLLPSRELSVPEKSCYVIALRESGSNDCVPLVDSGVFYNRCFRTDSVISCEDGSASGGFWVTGTGDVQVYGNLAELNIYDNNNPFSNRGITLLALAEKSALFGHIDRIQRTLLQVTVLSLLFGIACIALVSRRFSAPITSLAARVRGMKKADKSYELEHLGVLEIDQLVDSIVELNENVSKNIARTEFFSRMSHDMRTPMNAIIGFSSPDLLENADSALKDDYLKKINKSGVFLLGLINEVLDITKIESEKSTLRLRHEKADLLCETTLPIIQEIAQKKGVVFSAEMRVPPDLYVTADKQHINQIAINLLSNAVKFTKAGGEVKFLLEMTDGKTASEYCDCRIVVEDTGIGISEKFMKNIYTPFEQENSEKEGTGLGLSIAKKLVELMGGTIHCVSQINIGTTFTVTLPLVRSTAQTADKTETAEIAAKPVSLSGKRVLVFEDNALNAEIVCSLLKKEGAETTTASNGREGLDIFTASAVDYYDALLMDMQMPIMDGVSATKKIRSLYRTDAVRVPIIAMTANAFDSDVRACLDAGMNAHIAKPIEPEKFLRVLKNCIAQSQMLADNSADRPEDGSKGK